jgi:hypothetical protein
MFSFNFIHMKKIILLLFGTGCLLPLHSQGNTLSGFGTATSTQAKIIAGTGNSEDEVSSPTEGVINTDFVSEAEMKEDLLQMLANFMIYVKNNYEDAATTNSVNESYGYFKGENTMGSNEQGVRHNADLSMVCAFLYKYAKDKVILPQGVTWDDVSNMAKKSLIFAYSSHKANQLKACSDGKYWGSTSASDYVWESSLWAMSVAYSAFFQDELLSLSQKQYVYNLIKAECNYELTRSIPTGYAGDTKSEENGWETNILACALGLYPNDVLASQWYNRLRAFAINCYSHITDASNATVIDPDYDQKTVKDLYIGKNLYDDYTLQNHGYFHTSYQNVVIQELGESFLALKLFQQGMGGTEIWKTNALMHNNQNVMDKVLNKLALADGELAMPNGNDWSLFLYDQITSYSAMACFLKDRNALMLENIAYKNIKARQTTTADGSWLLRPDVGARRMGVQAHRVMMVWLMHEMASTANMTPASWDDFRKEQEAAEVFPSQNIVRAYTPDRFTCFSWSSGIKSYTGYFAQNSPDKNKIIVPYKANNTGNILGWYLVNGKTTNATPVVSGIYNLRGNSYTMNGVINTNDASLTNHFALYSTPGNAFIYIDYVKANSSVTITNARGGLLAVSSDEFTKLKRTVYYADGDHQSNGANIKVFATSWANIDNQIGIITPGSNSMAFGDRAVNNSIYTSKFYPFYSATGRNVNSGDLVDCRRMIYYSGVSAEETREYAEKTISLTDSLPDGWNGVIAIDPDGIRYMLVSNFAGSQLAKMKAISLPEGAPVFSVPTDISGGKSTARFSLPASRSVGDALRVFVTSGEIIAQQASDSISSYFDNNSNDEKTIGLAIITAEGKITGNILVPAYRRVLVTVENGAFVVTDEGATENIQGLPVKKNLPVELQSERDMAGVNGTKNTSALTFDPDGNYTVEISSTVSNVTAGRGMDLEVRSGYGTGFRTSLSDNSFKWAAPFDESRQISTTEGGKQVARYAVKDNQVYVYLNGSYVDVFDLASVGNMNEEGSEEISVNPEKPANMYDDINLITNPDFANDAHSAAPTGWLSDRTLGGGANPRIQLRENTTELNSYPAGKKAFFVRFDSGGGTYYSYAVTLKPDTWYEYSFDLISWGDAGKNTQFDFVVSKQQNASSDIITTQNMTSPSVNAVPERCIARFKTASSENPDDVYYLVYKKTTSSSNIGITDLYLQEKSIGGLLFGKNYTDGSADIHIDYIRVDYSGAFAPEPDDTTSIENIENADNKSIIVYSEGKQVIVKSDGMIDDVAIYDISGRCLLKQACNDVVFSTSLSGGIYILRINTGGSYQMRKFTVR